MAIYVPGVWVAGVTPLDAARLNNLETQYAKAVSKVPKTANQTLNNSVVLQNDDDLLFAVAANEVWEFFLWLELTQTVNTGFKWAFSIPALGALNMILMGDIGALAAPNVPLIMKDGTAATTTGAVNYANFVFLVWYRYIGGANAGNVQLQWAQGLAHADFITVHINSYIVTHQLA